jgi:hypothetical protein
MKILNNLINNKKIQMIDNNLIVNIDYKSI